jgi:hypothetical protein
MSEDRMYSQGDDLHVKANHDRTGTTLTLQGEFDMTGTRTLLGFLQRSASGEPKIDHLQRSRPDIHRFVWPHGLTPCP